MTRNIYRYAFAQNVSIDEIEGTLVLAIWGTESLHGEAQVRLDAAHFFDKNRRACVIDAGTPVGQDLNRLFVGFIRRGFNANHFYVERVTDPNPIHEPEETHE